MSSSVVDPKRLIVNSYTLIASIYCLASSWVFTVIYPHPLLAAVHTIATAVIVANYFTLKLSKNYDLATHTILATGTSVVVALFTTGGWYGSGYLWLFAYLPYAFFLGSSRQVKIWVSILFVSMLGVWVLQMLGVVAPVYTGVQVGNYFAALIVFTLCMFLFLHAKEKLAIVDSKTKLNLEKLNARLEAEIIKSKAAEHELSQRINTSKSQAEVLTETKRALVNILEDFTEEKDNLTAQKIKDEAILTSIGEGLIFIGGDGRIQSVNPAGLELLGYTEPELLGKWYPGVIAASDFQGKILPPEERLVVAALETGKPLKGQVNILRKDHTSFPAAITVSPVILDGKPIGTVEVFRDISEERRLEQAKEEFVSLASHQLRTPATGVKAFVSMLKDGYAGKLTAKQAGFLDKVEESNERQLRIIEDMLNVARAESGRMVLNITEFDPVSMLQDIISEQQAMITGRRQTIKMHQSSSTGTIVADQPRLRMVAENLISNASKYTPEGGKIDITMERLQNEVRLSVTDTGVGIPQREQAKLFKKFSRLPNELSTKVGGTGLGLYLAKQIIDLHGGRISFQSQVGKGSIFVISLPQPTRSRLLANQRDDFAKTSSTGYDVAR